jgi:oligoendopeptidase F
MRPLLTALALAAALPAAALDRAQVPERLTWSVADLYPDEAAWQKDKAALAARIPAFARHEETLGASPAALADALHELAGMQMALERLFTYAMLLSDQDTRQARPREMKDEVERMAVDLDAATSFVRPGILALDAATLRDWAGREPRLADFRFFLEDLARWKPHTLSGPEERIVARAGDLMGAGRATYALLKDADVPWPTVTLSDGRKIRLDPAGFALARTAAKAADRKKVFDTFFGAVKTYERTVGAALQAQVKSHLFTKDVRGFPSALEASLFRDAIPPAVYRQLLADVNASLPTLHRYLKLRQRMLGVKQLTYADLYAPIVADVKDQYTPDQAIAMTLEALQPMGEKYVAAARRSFSERWTDFMPTTGKRAGAYSTSVYGVHPYQLLNFNGQWEDVSTAAHEVGHTVHSVLSGEAQPYPTYNYPIFVTEVASTINENLLVNHVLASTRDDAKRLYLLGRQLETLRTTLFRQTMFAEFELAIHEKAEKGEALGGEALTRLYADLVRRYYGHADGICRVDDLWGVEWAYIPHFFSYDFYVYQYATSIVASTSLARQIREASAKGDPGPRDRFVALLAAGGSRYAIDLLRDAGVDMTTSAPFRAAMAEMNAIMDEMDVILARRPGKRT